MHDKSKPLSMASMYPLRVFAIVMSAIFAVEGAIMFALPELPAWAHTPLVEGLIDATMLTLAISPVVWWLAVVPIRRLFEARGELLHRLFRAQDEERCRIARDLHDEVGQQLTAILVGLKTIELAPDLESARIRARGLRHVGAAAHDEVRRLARGLRPGVLAELGLEAAVARICEEYERLHGTAIRLNVSPDACRGISPEIEMSLYRILQESLTNVARHAAATRIEVTLHRRGNAITLSVVDDGRGFPPSSQSDATSTGESFGLASIRERALTLGGKCLIQSHAQRGTSVQVSIPVEG
jgi:two-component system sensor histidine kinase UhpB